MTNRLMSASNENWDTVFGLVFLVMTAVGFGVWMRSIGAGVFMFGALMTGLHARLEHR